MIVVMGPGTEGTLIKLDALKALVRHTAAPCTSSGRGCTGIPAVDHFAERERTTLKNERPTPEQGQAIFKYVSDSHSWAKWSRS